MNATCEEITQSNERAWLDRNKDVKSSLILAQQIRVLLDDCPDAGLRELVLSLRTQGYCLDHLSRYPEALAVALKAMDLANQLGDLKLVASIDNVLGSIYWHLADYASSQDHYMHGFRLVRSEPDLETEIFLVQGLGTLYHDIGDLAEALKYFKASIESTPPGDIMGRAIGLNNIAFTLFEMDQAEEGLPYALEALDLYTGGPFSVGRLELLHTLGSIYLKLGDIERASRYFEDGVQAARINENPLQMINALFGVSQILECRGRQEEALQQALMILQISHEIGSLASQCSAHEMLARLYKQFGNYPAALEHYESFHDIHVQIFNEQAERRVHNIKLLLEIEAVQKEVSLYRALATTDELTGLLSRREFFETGEKAIRQARHRQEPVALLMVDLDNFKPINDQYGHAVGDQVLSIVARRIMNSLRQDDLAGRYGGDEFVILMPGIGLAASWKIAERCRSIVSGKSVDAGSLRLWLNISIGLAVSDAHNTPNLEEMIQQADRALLQAKKQGRNRIVGAGLA